jgi:two-component system, cell cycle sensor histidine kinase and response regulator CckA
MTQDRDFGNQLKELRQRAEATLTEKAGSASDASTLSSDDLKGLIHELQVHQIELEMQNEELRRAQLAVEESRDRYLDLYDYAPVAYFTLDRKGMVLQTNLTAVRFLEKERELLINKPFSRFLSQEDADTFYVHLTHVFETGAKQTCQVKLAKKDGDLIYAQLESVLIPDIDGQGSLCRTVASDISALKKAEAFLAQTLRLRSLGEMASGVAHNFNNILQIVMGNIELTLMDIESGDFSAVKYSLEKALHSSWAGAEIVKRLQSFANIRCQEIPTESKVFDLSHAVSQAVELTRPKWETSPDGQAIKIGLDLDLKEGCFTIGKEMELFEVAVNLIKNATEALRDGGEMTVSTKIEGHQVVFQVRDTGVGISEEHLGKLFDPFWSTAGLIRPGMGLAVCYGIVSRHGGTISVESEAGKGSTFTVRLPYLDTIPEDHPSTAAPTAISNLTILAIDDMELVLEFLRAALEIGHHKVLTALSGPEALDILRENQVDVVICDLGMPQTSGWEVGKKIKEICAERSTAKTPFIILTGWGGQILEKDKITESGVDFVLEKPVDISKLLTAIQEAVRKSRR